MSALIGYILRKLRVLWWRQKRRKHVRPWALSAPIVVLIIAMPLLRPLRQPDQLSDNEASRLATIQAVVEHGTLAINRTDPALRATTDKIRVSSPDRPASPKLEYSRQPPMAAVLLAGPYAVMRRFGLSLGENPVLVAYLLTVLGVTLPVAGAAGMVYRLSRLFELPRPWRAGLALATTCGSGLISYSTVLNSNAPAAALVLAACACLFHMSVSPNGARSSIWLVVAGLCASLAATIDLAAMVFLLLLVPAILALRWSMSQRCGGVLLYMLGAAPAVLLHAILVIPMTGDIWPGFLHPELTERPVVLALADDGEDMPLTTPGDGAAWRTVDALIGGHGLLSHFPVVIFGVVGIWLLLRRHWPMVIKTLGVITLVAGTMIVGGYILLEANWGQPMFSVRWYILFMPLLVFWSGVWLRTRHHAVTWAAAGTLLAFSSLVGLIGATDPFVRTERGQYTAYIAARRLLQTQAPPPLAPNLVSWKTR